MALLAVHRLDAWVSTPIDSWTDLRKVLVDWLMAFRTKDSVGSRTDVVCLDALARISRPWESILVTVH
jgi:hypothetical protein